MERVSEIWNLLSEKKASENFIHNALIRELEGGYFFGPHCHQNIELCLMLEGNCDVIINGDAVKVYQNNFLLLFPHVIHSFHVTTEKSCRFLQMHFYSNTFKNLSGQFYREIKMLYYLFTESRQYILAPFDNRLLSCVERIVSEMDEKPDNFTAMTNLYIYELILLLSREIEQSFQDNTPPTNPIADKAVKYINENIGQKLSLTAIADACNVSKRHLTAIFKKYMKITVNDYITLAKINKAMNLLYDKNHSITEISFQLGFSSPQYFSTIFKILSAYPQKSLRNLRCMNNW